MYPVLDHQGESYWPIGVSTEGKIEVQFQWLKLRRPFDQKSKRLEFLGRMNQLPGVSLDPGAIEGRPRFPLAALGSPETLARFRDTLDWFVQEVHTT